MFFQLPEILKLLPHFKTDRPVVVLAFNGILERPSLRVTLDANVVRLHEAQAHGVHDVRLRGLLHVGSTRTVAFFAAYVPFRHSLGLDIVIHRMAAVAKWSSGALRV